VCPSVLGSAGCGVLRMADEVSMDKEKRVGCKAMQEERELEVSGDHSTTRRGRCRCAMPLQT